MISNKAIKSHSILFALLLLYLTDVSAYEELRIAVLDFELRDMTVIPKTPEEIARTASVKPLLEEELRKSGYQIVGIPLDAQQQATSGVGYLFDHADVAAQLGKLYGADYVVVGRLHKPSFLFVYLMVHLVDVKKAELTADFLSEIKGSEKKLTLKGVESLTVKINHALKPTDQ